MVAALAPRLRPRWLAGVVGRFLALLTANSEHDAFRSDVVVEAEAAFDSRPVLPAIEVPVLLVNGDQDDYFPIDVVRETAALIADCTCVVYPGRDHLGAASDRRLASDILAFVGR